LRKNEKAIILDCLLNNCGNRTHTAKALGISRRQLERRLKEYGIIWNKTERHEIDQMLNNLLEKINNFEETTNVQ